MLNWANQFNICCFLDNHQYNLPPHPYECILAVGAVTSFSSSDANTFEALKEFSASNDEWLFGHFNYDVKNQLEDLHSLKPDYIGFPDSYFFVPETILILDGKNLSIQTSTRETAEEIYKQIITAELQENLSRQVFNIQSRLTKSEYLQTLAQLKKHILAGDCYEINFCQEFYQENVLLEPLQRYLLLSEISPNPFAGYYKLNDKYLLCASPERYLCKKGDLIISQPMKGTSKRDLMYKEKDDHIKKALQNSIKDRSENVMVVDLVRNDLSKICQEGTVSVEALYSVYSFPQVHQMISTISGKVKPGLAWSDCIKATFPMGSMTGAPKKRVMELIEQYEKSRRGLFSGTIGYITPDRDFDFNVVIRSILYNSSHKYLSYQVGSGITFYSDPEKEYEECLLKAEAIKKVLNWQHLI